MLRFVCVLALLLTAVQSGIGAAEEPVNFNRDIRPILSDRCFACHGPDAGTRDSDLRLDEVTRLRGGEDAVVIPGNANDSPLFQRIASTDPDHMMPPPTFQKRLSPDQIQLFRRWIDQGAPWEAHWSYTPVVRPELPQIPGTNHPVDQWVRARIQQSGQSWAAPADRVTLIRRLHFDLIGLPPTWEQVQQFLTDGSPGAYDAAVDRLLQSPHFGERLAMYWLDVVRFADSNGYHSDEPRKIAPYRDYVIESFNSNKQFDTFVTEQLAGDLLPNPTLEQTIASGFNMLLQTTSEGGGQPKEYIAKYAADRVRNTSQIFLGSTLGCAECHDHKYDPFTQQDFYSFAAFFADIEQPAIGNPPTFPIMQESDRAMLEELNQQLNQQTALLHQDSPELATAQIAWEDQQSQQLTLPKMSDWWVLGPVVKDSFDVAWESIDVDVEQLNLQQPVSDLPWVKNSELTDATVHALDARDSSSIYLFRTITNDVSRTIEVLAGSDDAIQIWLNGKSVHENRIQRAAAADQDRVMLALQPGENQLLIKITNAEGGCGFYFRMSPSELPANIAAILAIDRAARDQMQQKAVFDHFRSVVPELQPVREHIKALTDRKQAFEQQLPRTMMTKTGAPRTVRLLNRGDWMDESGPEMQPAIPAFLGVMTIPEDRPSARANRLDLARWMVDRSNPLTSRTMVNRLWKLYFGQGLAAPLDDLGRQGTLPTHPLLLDWLAAEFMESQWDLKHMIRLLVTSETYKQTSVVSESIRAADPYNKWYARQSRFRLDAELVRDNALFISGLLVDDVGGRSVYPYQPAGYWSHLNFPIREWPGDSGDNLYRRGLYTWWQRMFLHPSLLAFDAPSREECTVERPRSNIPQQALVLLNDPTYVEAARSFALRILQESGPGESERLNHAFRLALSRDITQRESRILTQVLHDNRTQYAANPQAAQDLLKTGGRPVPENADQVEVAAWTAVTRTILNLSETITRP